MDMNSPIDLISETDTYKVEQYREAVFVLEK